MSSLTGAEQVVKSLNDGGVKVMFANPGTTEMSIVEALDTVGDFRAVLGLHENVVTGAADGYGRMTGKPSATLLHLGVGLSNGIANLHNARRAGSPIINIIGEMSTWHRKADPLLGMDIEGLASAVSKKVFTINNRGDVATICTDALSASAEIRSGASRISTLVVPQNVAAERGTVAEEVQSPTFGYGSISEGNVFAAAIQADTTVGDNSSIQNVSSAIKTLTTDGKKCCLFVGGRGLWSPSLEIAGSISTATGATLMCENAFARIDRGGDLPAVHRLAYFPNDAQKELRKFSSIIFIGARVPVAMFGYDDMISELVDYTTQSIIEIDTHDVPGALKYIADELKVESSQQSKQKLPNYPKGKLNPSKLCSCIANSQPEGTILIDESLTSGGSYWQASQSCPSFSHLTLTGGAIGQGPPLATGAAIACPNRRVVNFQADGSGLYTVQALWTQAREKLNVTTVICSNKVYQILKIEQNKQKLSQTGSAAKSLTNLGEPDIDWVSIAKGFGVEAVKVTTCEDFHKNFETALKHDGPFLIEACL